MSQREVSEIEQNIEEIISLQSVNDPFIDRSKLQDTIDALQKDYRRLTGRRYDARGTYTEYDNVVLGR